MSEIPTYPNDEEYDRARDSAIASAARREERARTLREAYELLREEQVKHETDAQNADHSQSVRNYSTLLGNGVGKAMNLIAKLIESEAM